MKPIKAISPIIATVSLLFILIAIGGAAWLYISGYMESMTNFVEVPPNGARCIGTKAFVFIKNSGSTDINNTDHIESPFPSTDPSMVAKWTFDEADDSHQIRDSKGNNHGTLWTDAVLLMPFDEGSGDPEDLTAYGNNGALPANAANKPEWKGGADCVHGSCLDCVHGSCLYFDGSSAKNVSITEKDYWNFAGKEATITAWFKADGMQTGSGSGSLSMFLEHYSGKGWFLGFSNGYRLYYHHHSAVDSILLVTKDEKDNGDLYINNWYFVAVTLDGSDAEMYIDDPAHGPVRTDPYSDLTNDDSGSGLFIGSDSSHKFKGSVDEVTIHNKSLSTEEIKTLYTTGKASFLERVDDPERGRVLKFDGENDYVEIPDSPDLNPTDAITISAWVKLNDNNDLGAVIKKSNSTQKNGYTIEGRGSDHPNKLRFGIYNGACPADDGLEIPEGWCFTESTPELENGKWYHIIGTYDGSALRLYLNGTLVSEVPVSGKIIASANNLTIGKDPSNPEDKARFFNGSIDEVIIFNRSLSPSEIEPKPACSCKEADSIWTCSCGDLTIAKPASEGEPKLYFDRGEIPADEMITMTDYNCQAGRGKSCHYKIITGPTAAEAVARCS